MDKNDKETYVSFKTARLLKEKGFDLKIPTYYCCYCDDYDDYAEHSVIEYKAENYNSHKLHISAPTQQMACDWVEKTYGFFIEISRSIDLNGNYHFGYTILDKECKYVRRGYTSFDWSYEDAVEEAIKYCLENLI
jgi:hypothetical protein